MNVVISQSMLFPWVGILEQIRLADIFVHYDDVQFSKGSFTNRVQIKTAQGSRWMTVPLEKHRTGQTIEEVQIKPKDFWVAKHVEMIQRSFKGTPFLQDALAVVDSVYAQKFDSLAMLARESTLAVARYYNLLEGKLLVDVKDLSLLGSSSQRVLDVVRALKGSSYITGHGAKNYLDHDIFEENEISVRYMDYKTIPYPQLHGDFTPYVSSLDLIANCGPDGIERICSQAVYWKEISNEPN
jgi:hypothetical protein